MTLSVCSATYTATSKVKRSTAFYTPYWLSLKGSRDMAALIFGKGIPMPGPWISLGLPIGFWRTLAAGMDLMLAEEMVIWAIIFVAVAVAVAIVWRGDRISKLEGSNEGRLQ